MKTEAVTVVRMVVLAGKEIPTHRAKGELVVQSLEGKIALTVRAVINGREGTARGIGPKLKSGFGECPRNTGRSGGRDRTVCRRAI